MGSCADKRNILTWTWFYISSLGSVQILCYTFLGGGVRRFCVFIVVDKGICGIDGHPTWGWVQKPRKVCSAIVICMSTSLRWYFHDQMCEYFRKSGGGGGGVSLPVIAYDEIAGNRNTTHTHRQIRSGTLGEFERQTLPIDTASSFEIFRRIIW